MKQHDAYSDEYISAYIDGELDNEERAQILFDEQGDKGLAQRINDARIMKEKVQLAYSDVYDNQSANKPFSCTAFIGGHRSIAAAILVLAVAAVIFAPGLMNDDRLMLAKQLINNTQPIAAGEVSKAIGKNSLIVINFSRYEPQTFDATIENIEALLLQHDSDKQFHIEIVANKTGLKALDTKTSVHAERITGLAERFDSLSVVACAKSLANLADSGNPVQLMKSIIITPSAAQQVAKRIAHGWLYIKM